MKAAKTQALCETASALYDALPIGGKDVRFLELLPGHPTDPLVCHLFVRPIGPHDELKPTSHIWSHRTLGYRAIPYTWGGSTASWLIQCNGYEWKIGWSLFSALKHIRSRHRPQVLWADAICINQTDTSERNVQLRNVGEIFEKADEVIVWLGNGSCESRFAIEFLNKMDGIRYRVNDRHSENSVAKLGDSFSGPRFRGVRDGPSLWWGQRMEETLEEILRTIDISLRLEDVVVAVKNLFSRPWFSRVWVRQEVGWASHAEVLCADISIAWKSLVNGYENTAKLMATEGSYLLRVTIGLSLEGLRLGWVRIAEPRLLDLLHYGREADATVPHDKIYALMGMAADNFVGMLKAEYEKPLAIVFEKVAKFLINRDGLLDVIYAAEALKTVGTGLPSWVPNWAEEPGVSDLLLNRRG